MYETPTPPCHVEGGVILMVIVMTAVWMEVSRIKEHIIRIYASDARLTYAKKKCPSFKYTKY